MENDNDNLNPIFESIRSGDIDIEVVRDLLDQGVNVNSYNDDEESLLDVAASSGRADIASLLFDRGATIREGSDPLMTAICNNNRSNRDHYPCVKVFIDNGVKITSQHLYAALDIYVGNGDFFESAHLESSRKILSEIVNKIDMRDVNEEQIRDAFQRQGVNFDDFKRATTKDDQPKSEAAVRGVRNLGGGKSIER